MTRRVMPVLSGMALALMPAGASAREAGGAIPPAVLKFHQDLLTLDTHLDTPANVAIEGWSIENAHDVHIDYTQVDVPRMKKGGLDGGFWAIYTPQGPLDAEGIRKARDFGIRRALVIREMVAADPDNFVLATTAEDAAPIAGAGKRIVYMSMENAYPLGNDISLVQLYYDIGVRLIGFAHFANNQFADSSTDPRGEHWGGLSPLGMQLLAEMNRLGIVPDASHSSDKVLDDLLRLSKAPIILSHSGCKAIYDHPRNIDDDHLRALAARGGVIHMNAYGAYLRASKPDPERQKALSALFSSMREKEMTKAEHDKMTARLREIDTLYPDTDKSAFDDFMKHVLHALKVAGVDHVGIGLDWDGGGGVTGMEDVSALPRITAALLDAGYSKADIAKIWSGNVLRVLAENRRQAAAVDGS